MIALLGALFGGLFRLAPELFKFLDRKAERQHELAMFGYQLEADKARSEARTHEIEVQGEVDTVLAELSAIKEGVRAQGKMTGIRWVDALNNSFRPVVAYFFVGLYMIVKLANLAMLYQSGTPVLSVIVASYTESDAAMLWSILSFWYVGRTIDKRK